MLAVQAGAVPVQMVLMGYDANRGSEIGGIAAPGAGSVRDAPSEDLGRATAGRSTCLSSAWTRVPRIAPGPSS